MFILLIIYLTMLFFVFVFQFRKKQRVKGISHGKKLNLKNLTIPQPGEQNDWFWSEVNMFGLTPLLTSGWTIFAGKNSKNINLLWLLALQDMDELDSWSWGGMGLTFPYEQLSLASNSSVASCGGYIDLACDNICFSSFLLIGS